MESTTLFYEVHKIEGNISDQILYVFRPVSSGGYFYDILSINPTELSGHSFPIATDFTSDCCRIPTGYQEIFNFSSLKSVMKMKVFRPVPPSGYAALGCVCAECVEKIPKNVLCVKESLAIQLQCEKIEIFNPLGESLSVIRNIGFSFEIGGKPMGVEMAAEEEKSKEFLQPLIEKQTLDKTDKEKDKELKNELISAGPACQLIKLPLLDVMGIDEAVIEKTDENDTMTNVMICQQPVQLADILANTSNALKLMINPESSHFYIQQAVGFQLVGVTSLTTPEDYEKLHEEKYLYLYEPIPPPGFVAMGLTCSTEDGVKQEIYCVNERYVQYTTQIQLELGKVYDQDSAVYIQEMTQIKDLNEEEKLQRIENMVIPKMNKSSLVIPRQSQYISLLKEKYPIILPQFAATIFSRELASQKSLLKAMKSEPSYEQVCEIEAGTQTIQVFKNQLKKDEYNHYHNFCKLKPSQPYDLQAEITQLQSVLQANQKQITQTPAADQAKKASALPAAKAADKPAEKPAEKAPPPATFQPLPLELQIMEPNNGFDTYAVAEPRGFQVIYQQTSPQNVPISIIQLLPRPATARSRTWSTSARYPSSTRPSTCAWRRYSAKSQPSSPSTRSGASCT